MCESSTRESAAPTNQRSSSARSLLQPLQRFSYHSDTVEREKQSVSINEFLKPAEGESYYNSGGRGRGRGGRGTRGGFRGNSYSSNVPAPSIEDPGHFPTLGAK